MAESRKFTQLSSELSIEDRNDLLKKLTRQSNLSKEPLYENKNEPVSNPIETRFQRLPWYEHFFLVILSFFKNKSPLKVFEDRLISKIGLEVDIKYPGYFDHRQLLLLPLFFSSLSELKKSVRFFKDAFDVSFNRDRGAFYAFLGSLEMTEIHKRLEEETLPSALVLKHPELKDVDLKPIALDVMENAFAGINEDQRNAMYNHARSLSCLKELSFFLFDRVLYAFANDISAGGMTCSVTVVREQLAALNNILFSLKTPPSIVLLESLFVFVLQEQAESDEMDVANESKNLLATAENSLMAIREFNRLISLTLILRVANRNIALTPTAISGGEDWFSVYRDYWKQHIEHIFEEYIRARRQKELLESFRSFLKGAPMKALEHIESETNPDGLPVRMSYDLSFLLTFHSVVFVPDIAKVLRPILLEAEFIKRENRTLFTESYNDLMKLDEDIKRFDQTISPNGEIGKQYAIAQADMSLTNRRRKIQSVVESANEVANSIVSDARQALAGMLTVLQGIAKKDADGKNEMISNTNKFIGKSATANILTAVAGSTPAVPAAFTPKGIAFFNGINDVIQSLQQAIHVIENIGALGLN